MTGNDVVPEVLWTPTPERMARAAITDFTEFVADRTGRAFTDYAALWDYSTSEPAGFWGAVADYFQVKLARPAHRRAARGRDARRAVVPRRHPQLRRARPGRRRDGAVDDPAVIAVERGRRPRSALTRAELRAQVGAAPGGTAPARRRRRATGSSRWCPTRVHALVAFLATAASAPSGRPAPRTSAPRR